MENINYSLVSVSCSVYIDLNLGNKQDELLGLGSQAIKQLKFLNKSSIIPLSENAPKELPRLSLLSNDGDYILNIADSVYTFIYATPSPKYTFKDEKAGFLQKIEEVNKFFLKALKVKEINNIEFTISQFAEVKSSVDFIKNLMLNSSIKKKRLYQLQVGYTLKSNNPMGYIKKITISSLIKKVDLADSGLGVSIFLSSNIGNAENNRINMAGITKMLKIFNDSGENPLVDLA